VNAAITFKEWIDDFGSEQVRESGEKLLKKEIAEIEATMPNLYPKFRKHYERTVKGERDLYF
jgi:2-iminoacetate synthase